MKKFSIIRDKKLFWLIVISMIYNPSITLITLRRANKILIERGSYINFNFISFLFPMFILIFYIILLKQIYQLIKIDDNKFSVGITTMQVGYCNILADVEFTDKIEIAFKNIKKK